MDKVLMDEVLMETFPPTWKAAKWSRAAKWNHPGTSTQLLEQLMEPSPSNRSC